MFINVMIPIVMIFMIIILMTIIMIIFNKASQQLPIENISKMALSIAFS